MRAACVLCAAFLLTSLLGCVPALYPYFTDDSLVSGDQFIGTWEVSKNGTWTLSGVGEDYYRLVQNHEDSTLAFRVRFFKVADILFADISPLKDWDNIELFGMLMAPTHIVARLEGSGDTVRIGVFDGDWYTSQVKAGALDLDLAELDDASCVLAPTQRLQEAIAKFAHDSAAFPMEMMYRVKAQQ